MTALLSAQGMSSRQIAPAVTALVLDFDGVIHEHPEWRIELGRLDCTIIRQAFTRGFPVAVSTCNTVSRVASALAREGFAVFEDARCRFGQTGWDGGKSGRVILVTGRKVSGYVVDDRCLHWRYGNPTADLWRGLDAMAQAERARDLAGSNRELRHELDSRKTGGTP